MHCRIIRVAYLDLQKFGVNLRVELSEIGVGRNETTLENQDRLDQAGDPTGPFQMAHVRFHGTARRGELTMTHRGRSARPG